MGWPQTNTTTIKSFADGASVMQGKRVRSVKLLGYGRVPYTVDATGLHVTLPAARPGGDIAPVLAVVVK